MTISGSHHLPEPDGAELAEAFQVLEDARIPLTPGRRLVLSAAHQFGWLDGPDGFRQILLEALDAPPPASRTRRSGAGWAPLDDGRGFRCDVCGNAFGDYSGPYACASAAAAHVRRCAGEGERS